MKTLSSIFLSIFLMSSNLSFCQEKPQEVYSIVKHHKEHEWYVKQHELWEDAIQSKSKDERAWINYYAAARMARFTAKDKESIDKWLTREEQIIEEMEKEIKGTYAYYRLMAWNYPIWGTSDKKEQEKIKGYILKAYELQPENPEIYPSLFNLYEVYQPDEEKMKEVAIKWKASGDFSPTLMALSYNVLMNTKKNAILITAGDNDTYPLWIAQYVDSLRTDVRVCNISLMMVEDYRNRIFKELGIPALEVDQHSFGPICDHIIKHRGDRLVYFSNQSIVPKDSALYDHLYNVGVIYQYSEKKFNNQSLVVDNFENEFLLDHIKYDFYQSKFPEMDRRYNIFYIPGLLTLYNHYLLIEEDQKAKETKDLVLKLAKNTNFEDYVKKVL